MESLHKVLKWRVDDYVSQEDFSTLYTEFLKHNSLIAYPVHLSSPSAIPVSLTHRLCFEQEPEEKPIDNLQQKISLLGDEHNTQLLRSDSLGIDGTKTPIKPCKPSWIFVAENLFSALDEEGRGFIDADRLQFFLLALLSGEITAKNKEAMVPLVRKQVSMLLTHMQHRDGEITLRNFKGYLVLQRLR